MDRNTIAYRKLIADCCAVIAFPFVTLHISAFIPALSGFIHFAIGAAGVYFAGNAGVSKNEFSIQYNVLRLGALILGVIAYHLV